MSLSDSKPLYTASCAFAYRRFLELGLVLVVIAAVVVAAAAAAIVTAIVAVAVAVVVVTVAVVAAAVVVMMVATSIVVVTAVVVDIVRWVCGPVPIEAALTVTVMMVVMHVAAASV